MTTAPIIPDYELTARIGAGAYGEVWLARNLATGAQRAIKIVHRSTFTDDRPFHREFEGLKKFETISHSHPSQLALFHVGRNTPAGYFYYVMELADAFPNVGDDVRSLTSTAEEKSETPHVVSYKAHTLRADLNHSRLPAPRVLQIALSLTEALSHLHQNALIHRDVKPSNIIFVQGRPKLADIGLVTDASDSRSIVGTEGYLPAEGPGTPAADLFALGKVLYEALTGHDRRQYPELPADLRAWPDAKLAFELNTILLKLCAPHPRDRYPTADALLADLKHLDAGKSIQTRRRLKRAWTLSWKVAALFLICSFFFLNKVNKARREADPFTKFGTTNTAAWQALQRAIRIGGAAYTADGLSNSIPEIEQALALDPNFGGAWGLLSLTLTLSVTEGYIPGTNSLPRAQVCAQKAIGLSRDGGYKYLGSLAQCNLALDYDFAKAEPLFRKEIQEFPESWPARNNFAWELIYQSHFTEAEQLFSQIQEQNPQVGAAPFALGFLRCVTGRTSEGLPLLDAGIRLDPDRPRWRLMRGDILWSLNDRAAAARDWIRQVEVGGYPTLDRRTDAAALLQSLNQRGPEALLSHLITLLEASQAAGHFVSGFDLARLHAHAGHRSRALDCLEIAFDEHRGLLLSANINPAFANLRAEARFNEVMRRLNLAK